MKVSELEGRLLDCWVAKCENPAEKIFYNCDGYTLRWHVIPPSYSTDWNQGGPIIDRERMTFGWSGVRYDSEQDCIVDIEPPVCVALFKGFKGRGPNYLIAGMRAYVASKFGDTVPDEVTQ